MENFRLKRPKGMKKHHLHPIPPINATENESELVFFLKKKGILWNCKIKNWRNLLSNSLSIKFPGIPWIDEDEIDGVYATCSLEGCHTYGPVDNLDPDDCEDEEDQPDENGPSTCIFCGLRTANEEVLTKNKSIKTLKKCEKNIIFLKFKPSIWFILFLDVKKVSTHRTMGYSNLLSVWWDLTRFWRKFHILAFI